MTLRYNKGTDLVIFFFKADGHNPAVTQTGSVVSVGTMPVRIHGRIADTRARNPLHGRRDFDLTQPDSLELIDDCLRAVMDKCERRS